MDYVPEEVREVQCEQGWTDETLLDLVFQALGPEEVSKVVKYLDGVAEDENSEIEEEEDRNDEPSEPEDQDLITSDHVHFYEQGAGGFPSPVVTVPEGEDWRPHVLAWMESQSYFPNVWFVSDHGNPIPLSVSRETK